MSYTKLFKKWERESKERDKQERIARKKRKEMELKRADELFIARMREEKRQQEAQEKKMKEVSMIKDNLLLQLRKNNPFTYKQYLIIWDVLTGNYMQIESDMVNERINKHDVKLAITYINEFSKEIISEYWNEKLLSITA